MYLQHVSIRNFRLFENLELSLNPGLNILVGENDSGKTALIDAIRYVLGTNSSERSYLNETDFYNDSNELSIQLKFTNVDKHAHVFIEHLTHENDPVDEEKRQSVLYVQLTAKNTGKERRGYPFILTEVKSGLDGNGLVLESEVRAFLSTTYLKPLRDAEAQLSSGRASRLSQILNSSKELIHPDSIKKILDLIAKTNTELVKPGEPIHDTSQRIQDDYLHQLIFEEDKSILKAIIDIAGIRDTEGPLDTKKRRHFRTVLEGLNLSLTEENRSHGLGYNNLLFMAAELLLLEQELDSEFPLLLIEEPEAHLHPQLQMKLLQFIISKAKTKEKQRGIQCILTTHSPNISSKADPKDIVILHQGKSFSLRSEQTELDIKSYKFLQKFLDVTKANLFFARGVILVEGDSENILIPTIAKLLGRPLEDYGVSVINIGNTGWKHFVKLFLREGLDDKPDEWNPIKIAVLRDLDLWPLCAQESEQSLYGFITRKEPDTSMGKTGNLWRWLNENEDERVEQIIEQQETLKIDQKKSLERQNVKVCISDYWTFEYCLSFFGLFDECFRATNGPSGNIDEIAGTDEEKATYIQREVSKTEFAAKMALLLEKKYKENSNELRGKLPPYLVAAIEHVTAPFLVSS